MNQQPFGGGAAAGPDFAVLFMILAAVLAVVLLVQVVVIYLFLYKPASQIPEQYRQTSGGAAFLLLVPLFGLVWIFLYTQKLSRSFQDWLGTGPDNDCGEKLGMWWGICTVASIIPIIGSFIGLASLVLMIMYLVKINESLNRGRALGSSGAAYGAPTSREFDDPGNPYAQ